MLSNRRRIETVAVAAALVLLFAFYVASRPLVGHVSDSYAYVNTVETESFDYFFHPHHVLYIPLAWRWNQAFHAVVPWVSTWTTLSVLSALFGCAGVAAMYRTWRLLGAPDAAAAGGALLQALLFGYWFFSVEPEVYVISAALALWAFHLLVMLAKSGNIRFAAWAGVVAGLAALFHQTGVFLIVPAVVLALALKSSRARLSAAVLYAAAFAVTVVPVYYAACWAATGAASPGALVRWTLLFGEQGYGGFTAAGAAKAFVGLSRALVGAQAALDWARGFTEMKAHVVFGLLAGLAGAVLLGAFLTCAVRAMRGFPWSLRKSAAFAAASAFAAYGIFSAYFDPANFEWWTIPLGFFVLAVGIAALTTGRKAARLAVSAAVLIGASNYMLDFAYRSRPDNDIVRGAARVVAALSNERDVIVVPSFLGSVLWYEARTRTVHCPDKSIRLYGEEGAWREFDILVRDAGERGGRVVVAGMDADAWTRDWSRRMRRQYRLGEMRIIGGITFFTEDGRLLRRVVDQPVMAMDAEQVSRTSRPDGITIARGADW